MDKHKEFKLTELKAENLKTLEVIRDTLKEPMNEALTRSVLTAKAIAQSNCELLHKVFEILEL